MNAWVIDDFGGPDVFTRTNRPKPTPKPGYLTIQVAATSVNPVDYKIRDGSAEIFAPERPAILHGDVAGIVEAVGEGVEGFKPGDEVYACAGGFKNEPHGALADYMPADARFVAHKPSSLSLLEAAALPLVVITAWEALIDKTRVEAGHTVLVHGATGGVGHVGLQLATWRGAEVYVTGSSQSKLDTGTDLGADGVINYTEESVEDYVARCTDGRGFDVVFDTVGGDNVDTSIQAAALNGQVVSIAAREEHNLVHAYLRGISVHTVLMLIPIVHHTGRARHGDILRQAAGLVDSGHLRPLIDRQQFTFDEIGDAHAHTASGNQVGKVVVAHPGFA